MSTTPTPPSPPKAEPIAEPDRLGPLATPAPAPAVAPSFATGAAVRALVLAAVHDAVEPARAALRRAGNAPATAVHEVRKSLRRTRALVDLLGDTLPRRERKDIRKALIEARRSLGPSRDLTVASKALLEVATADDVAPAAAAIVTAARADAPSAESVTDDIARAVAAAEAQAAAIGAALPDEVEVGVLVRGLADTYRRARRARKRAGRSDRAAHRWRRRSKELIYQLSIFGDVAPAAELRTSLSELDDQLGQVVDRLMLNDFVGLYGHAAEAEAVGRLLTQLHDELLERRDRTRKDSKALFAARPRKLRKRLGRAINPPEPDGADAPDGDDAPDGADGADLGATVDGTRPAADAS